MYKLHAALVLFMFCFLLPAGTDAQSKSTLLLEYSIKQSIGADKTADYYSQKNNIIIDYYKKRRFRNPQMELSGAWLLNLDKHFMAGLQAGINFNFSETYTSSMKITSVSFPVRVAGYYTFGKSPSGHAGLDASAGLLFFTIHDTKFERYQNGWMYSYGFFYRFKKTILRLGIENRFDKVTFFVDKASAQPQPEEFKYTIARPAITLSCRYLIRN